MALIPVIAQLIWLAGLAWRGRLRRQPVLATFLALSSLSTLLVSAAVATEAYRAYRQAFTLFRIGLELITLVLLATALLETATLYLDRRPRYQAIAAWFVRSGLFIAGFAAVGVAFAPVEWINTWRDFHIAQRVVLPSCLAVLWVAFWLLARYFQLEADHKADVFGWTLTVVIVGSVVVAITGSPTARSVSFWLAAACYAVAAAAALAPERASDNETPNPPADSGGSDDEIERALGRLRRLDDHLHAIGDR
jgi:hypothetical protein